MFIKQVIFMFLPEDKRNQKFGFYLRYIQILNVQKNSSSVKSEYEH